jgi:ABC-type transport system involved in multi-copper enzyme maturation permease subunit
MTGFDAGRIRAVIRKELLDYRRKRAIVVTMAILPCVFLIQPVVTIFLAPTAPSAAALEKSVALSLLYLLLIPVILPATLAAYTVVGEREQGTLEPLLTTPIRQQELILGKAAAVMIPSMALSYAVFGLFLAAIALFAHPVVGSAVFNDGPVLLALFLFTPLVAGWAIVVGMAVSVRASEVRVAQQLGTLASFPIIAVVLLLAVDVIHPSFPVALEFAIGLLAIDLLALRIVSQMFDRERLVTGAKSVSTRQNRRSHQPTNSVAPFVPAGRESGTATLRVSRKWGGVIDRSREWQIIVDGNEMGSIASQKMVELSIEPGRHTVRLGSHRHTSPERSFEAEDGRVVSFRCRGAMGWPVYLAALVKPDLWISLRQD